MGEGRSATRSIVPTRVNAWPLAEPAVFSVVVLVHQRADKPGGCTWLTWGWERQLATSSA